MDVGEDPGHVASYEEENEGEDGEGHVDEREEWDDGVDIDDGY